MFFEQFYLTIFYIDINLQIIGVTVLSMIDDDFNHLSWFNTRFTSQIENQIFMVNS